MLTSIFFFPPALIFVIHLSTAVIIRGLVQQMKCELNQDVIFLFFFVFMVCL